ncbi:hypothetical protein FDZ74_04895 [bacterium]|nr:MAG: hypothetical protein FDZ74_04895 [bacterium]
MKYFFGEIQYLVPTETLDQFVSLHRAFLQSGYDQDILLVSGPKVPRTGAVLVARGESLEAVQAFFANDPYQLNHLAVYTFQEFNPVKFHPLIKDWIVS